MRARFVLAALFAVHLSAAPSPAQAAPPRLDTPSGFPVPRFVSLKDEETNCRIGPSFDHPVRFVFKRAGAPVLVVAESVDHWRRIRDAEGDECWAHQTTLKAQTHVLARRDIDLHARPSARARLAGRIGPGVLARIVRRRDDWLLVSAGDARGWLRADDVWGGAARD